MTHESELRLCHIIIYSGTENGRLELEGAHRSTAEERDGDES